MRNDGTGGPRPLRDLTVGELSARAGVSVSALHFYERRDLIRSYRTSGNQRRYPRDVLRRVSLIKTAQSLGLSLERIADALATLPADHAPNAREWQAMAENWGAELNDRIARLELLRDLLTGCIGCGCLSTQLCPLVNPRDRLAARGSGPQYLSPGVLEEEACVADRRD